MKVIVDAKEKDGEGTVRFVAIRLGDILTPVIMDEEVGERGVRTYVLVIEHCKVVIESPITIERIAVAKERYCAYCYDTQVVLGTAFIIKSLIK
jgi:hypothetical protein